MTPYIRILAEQLAREYPVTVDHAQVALAVRRVTTPAALARLPLVRADLLAHAMGVAQGCADAAAEAVDIEFGLW